MRHVVAILVAASTVWESDVEVLTGEVKNLTTESTQRVFKKKPLQETNTFVDVNGKLLTISYPTSLDPNPWGGSTLVETLEIIRNFLNGFWKVYESEIRELSDLRLFTGEIVSYDERVMKILYSIFTNEGRGETWGSPITCDFNRHPKDLFKDMDDLKELIKSKDTKPEEAKILLEEIQIPFHLAKWMTAYYWNHMGEYLQKKTKKTV